MVDKPRGGLMICSFKNATHHKTFTVTGYDSNCKSTMIDVTSAALEKDHRKTEAAQSI